MYTPSIRKCAYHCLANQTPLYKVGNLIGAIVEELAGKCLTNTPSKTTVGRTAREMGVISYIQVGEALSSGDVTLGFDATSLAGSHLNEIHISTGKQGLTAGIASLPGGTTQDYVGHIHNTLDDLSLTSAQARELEPQDTLQKMTSNIACTITDRCVVNHAVVRTLSEDPDKEIIELNCNVHSEQSQKDNEVFACSGDSVWKRLCCGEFTTQS